MGIYISHMQRKGSGEALEKWSLIQRAFSFRCSLYLELDPDKTQKRKMEHQFLGTNSVNKIRSRGSKIQYIGSEEGKKRKAKTC